MRFVNTAVPPDWLIDVVSQVGDAFKRSSGSCVALFVFLTPFTYARKELSANAIEYTGKVTRRGTINRPIKVKDTPSYMKGGYTLQSDMILQQKQREANRGELQTLVQQQLRGHSGT
jgi:hypothetical protein